MRLSTVGPLYSLSVGSRRLAYIQLFIRWDGVFAFRQMIGQQRVERCGADNDVSAAAAATTDSVFPDEFGGLWNRKLTPGAEDHGSPLSPSRWHAIIGYRICVGVYTNSVAQVVFCSQNDLQTFGRRHLGDRCFT